MLIHTAAERGRYRLLRKKLEAGESPNSIGSSRKLQGDWETCQTVLYHAVRGNQVASIDLLVEFGAQVDFQIRRGYTVLNFAAECGKVESLQALIRHGAKVNGGFEQNQGHKAWGVIPLHTAAMNGQVEALKALLSAGAIVDLEDPYYGRTALHYAVTRNNPELVRALIDAGADIDKQSRSFQETPLHRCSGGCELVAQLLIDAGADLTIRNSDGKTAEETCQNRYCEKLHHLLRSARFEREKRALMESMNQSGYQGVFGLIPTQRLISVDKLKRDIGARNRKGQTPLHLAAELGNLKYVSMLIRMGADVLAVDANGLTPIQAANGNESVDLIQARMNQLEIPPPIMAPRAQHRKRL